MKQIIFAALVFFSVTLRAQVGIGTVLPNGSAQLDISSADKGILIPRLTAEAVAAITSPATGLLVFQTDDTPGFYFYNGAAWVPLHSGVISTANGGTGSATQNFVDLSTDQVIGGIKNFSSDINAGSITATSYTISAGTSSQFLKADGSVDASTYLTSTDAENGYLPLSGGILTGALIGTTADFSGNSAVGGTLGVAGNLTATGTSNSLGTITSGVWNAGAVTSSAAITGVAIVRSGGAPTEFLKADGSIDASTYLTSSAAGSTYLPLSGGTLTGGLTGTTAGLSGNLTVGGTMNVNGPAAVSSNLNVSGNTEVDGDLAVAGNTNVGLSITVPAIKTPTNVDIVKSIEASANVNLLTAAASGIIVVVKNISASSIMVSVSISNITSINAGGTGVFMRISESEFSTLFTN